MSRSAFFGLVLPVVVGLAVVVGIWRSLWAPITTDEGANLEVVSSAASGVGYASHGTHRLDMWWSAKPIYAKLLGTNPPSVYRPEPWFFDPRITTGPSVLLPLSLVWFVFPGNLLLLRLITVGFLVLFLVALWRLSTFHDRWLTFAAAASITLTYRFGPAVTLGDLAAVAYLAWGTILLLRTRTFWAGILFGLAVLAKLVAFVGVMGALGVFLALTYFTPAKQRRPNLLVLGLGAALPLLLFEVYRFVLLGSPSDYMVSWKEFIDFLQWRTGPGSAERLTSKLRFLGQFGPGIFFGLCYFTLAARILVSWKELKKIWQNEDATGRIIAPGLMFCGGGLPIFVVWLFFTEQAGPRQIAPGQILFFAGLILLNAEVGWWVAKDQRRSVVHLLGFGSALLVVSGAIQWTSRFVESLATGESWTQQVEAAEAIKASGAKSISSLASPFEPYPFLTGLPVSPCPMPQQALVITARSQAVLKDLRNLWGFSCARLIWQRGNLKICFLRELGQPRHGLPLPDITDWGPKTLGQQALSSEQDVALWFRVGQQGRRESLLTLVVNGQPASAVAWAPDGTWFSAGIPSSILLKGSSHRLALFSPCTGELVEVGVFSLQRP